MAKMNDTADDLLSIIKDKSDVSEVSMDNTEMSELEKKSFEEAFENDLASRYNSLVSDVQEKLDEADRARQIRESQWLRNVQSYRGKDTPEGHFRGSEKSKVFVRTTTVKVKAAYAQIIEALFSDSKFPISVESTFVPEGVTEFAHLKTDMAAEPAPEVQEEPQGPLGGIGFEGDGFQPEPGSTISEPRFLGGMTDEFTDESGNQIMAEGLNPTEGVINIQPAKELARRMEKIIHDRLEETKARTEVRKAIFEMCLLGTGIMKGPFNITKTLHKWTPNPETGENDYTPEQVQTARSSMVSAWNFYPDPNATRPEEMEWVIERHKMNSSQLRSLRDRPHFDSSAISRVLLKPGNYSRKSFEHTLDEKTDSQSEARLYEVLEYWGYMDREKLVEYNLPVDSMMDDQVQVNVWVCCGEVLRVVVNPFLPQRIPYFVVPYEMDPYSIWGTGIPESMEDAQAMMNGFSRLAVDNLALAGNMVFDIDDSMLIPGQEMEIYPGKIFRRQAGGAGQAIYGVKFPNTAPENMMMFKEFRQLADESTGIPSFAHGQTGVMSPTRTASGMSMLLNNASLNIKTVIRNLDDFLLRPWGEAYYRWEMQFNQDVSIKGDLEVKATGSTSLQAKEVRSQRLNSFLQMAANPALAPLIKLPTVLREFAITMDIDPDEILNNPEEAQIYAQLMGMQNMQHPQPGAQGPAMGPDGVPMPNEQGFTGNTESSGGEMAALMAQMGGQGGLA